jgi:hypothetical protein
MTPHFSHGTTAFLEGVFRALCHPPMSLFLVLALGLSGTLRAAETAETFASPEAAVSALIAAAGATDHDKLRILFGAASEELVNADRVQATNEMEGFTAAFHRQQRLVYESDSRCVLEVGEHAWPFPIPLVKQDGRWFFDTEAGKEEVLNRRIGRNELSTLRVMRAYVEAQREYAARDRDGDEVLEYAQKVGSTPGLKDGLYWPLELDGEISPLGPLVALAQEKGYRAEPGVEGTEPQPFHGYLFKSLTRQAGKAPGGRYHYIINGNMIGGFALVAWPAEYGQSGVMTFMVSHQGRVLQKNLGDRTSRIAAGMRSYQPDETWLPSRE